MKRNVKSIGIVINRFHKPFRLIFNPCKESKSSSRVNLLAKPWATYFVTSSGWKLTLSKPIAYMRDFNVFAIVELQHFLRLWECAYISVQKWDTEIWWKEEKQMEKWKEWSELEDVIWELREPTCQMLKAPNARELAHFSVTESWRW